MKKWSSLFAISAILLTVFFSARNSAMAASTTVDVKDYLSADKWVDDGGNVTVSSDKILFNTGHEGDYAALKMVDEFDNVTYRFNIKLENVPTDLSEEEGTWWDSEFALMLRAKLPATTYEIGQAGYCITSWGDHSGFYVGKSGNDDYFTNEAIPWSLADGKVHNVEFSAENNTDGSVYLKFSVDGEVLFEGIDKGEVSGTKKVEQQQKIHTGKGALMFRCKNITATITAYGTNTSAVDTSTGTDTPTEDTSKTADTETSTGTSTSVNEADSDAASGVNDGGKLFLRAIIIIYLIVAVFGIAAGIIAARKKKAQ